MTSRQQYLTLKKLESNEKNGRLLPDDIDCIYFNVCCDCGAYDECIVCEKNKKRTWRNILVDT